MFQMRLTMLFLFLLGVTCDSQIISCDPQDQSSLLQLKHDLVFNSTESYKVSTWNSRSDCCTWEGITCRADDGHVTAIELSSQYISGGINDSSSPLFDLHHLQLLDLSGNDFNGIQIPSGIGRLVNLLHLRLDYSNFGGQVPPEISTLSLRTLDLSASPLHNSDSFSGTLSEIIGNKTTLTHLVLDGCGFSGSITNIFWENFENLVVLRMSGNAFNGTIPLSLFSLPSIESLDLSQNQFNRFSVGEFPILSPSPFIYLWLDGNKLEGPVPTFIFNLHNLESLGLSYNNFSGTFDLSNLFQNLPNLTEIDLSYNSLSVMESSDLLSPRNLGRIDLVSCNLEAFPSLLTNRYIQIMDLSHNNIVGEIPNWIWNLSLNHLNLSHNSLTGFEGPSPNLTSLTDLAYLDLSSNQLQGQIPFAPLGVGYDLYIEFLSLSNNNFHGGIPRSLCSIFRLSQPVIDLSNNSFCGTVPPCLVAMSFGVLNLKKNNLSGNIPNTFRDRCYLQTLDLSDNHFHGTVPKSMMNCRDLEVLNLGNNGLSDEFPFWLMNISTLRVLVLRSNKFYGPIRYGTSKQASGWPQLQIIDIADNNFSGKLPPQVFKSWRGMMGQTNTTQEEYDKLGFGLYYTDTVVVNNKGFSVELVRILAIFTTIDLSCNHFEGSIPHSIGDLTSLYALNLSHNRFTGHIPSSFGDLKGMESLDLAHNRISGVIPDRLASLTFLSYLNLSYNQLVGKIPTSTQLQSFSEWSYTGNEGLYGQPLDEVSSGSACGPPPDPTSADVGKGIDWQLIRVEIGYPFGLGAVIGSLLFWRRWRFWFFERVDRLLFWVFPRLNPDKRNRRKRS